MVEADTVVGATEARRERRGRRGLRKRRHRPIAFCHRSRRAIMESVVELGQRRALVEGDMVGLGALNFILRSVHAGVTGVAFDVEIAGMYSDDRAADTSSL